MSNRSVDLDVLIVGAGLSGMSAYLEAKIHPGLRVGLVEHEAEPGGELRFYPGYPAVHEFRAAFLNAGGDDPNVRFRTTVVGVLPSFREGDPLDVSLSAADGTYTVKTKALLICTGMFDSSRENNRVPGQRPAGVYTPGFVVRVLEHGVLPGRNLVVHVESRRDVEVIQCLQQAGATIAAVIGQPDRLEGFRPDLKLAGVPVVECRSVSRIDGHARVQAVAVETDQGPVEFTCDGLIYASGRHSSIFALKGTSLKMDPATKGIWTDDHGRTSIPGVFAAGTCVDLHPDHAHSVERGLKVMAHIAHSLSRRME